jgi:hypothetical protein
LSLLGERSIEGKESFCSVDDDEDDEDEDEEDEEEEEEEESCVVASRICTR